MAQTNCKRAANDINLPRGEIRSDMTALQAHRFLGRFIVVESHKESQDMHH
jgi:hypothetical protein